MDLFHVLSFDERVIVLSDVGEGVVYTWNRSALQVWRRVGHQTYDGRDFWEEIDIRTLSTEPKNYEEARRAARSWRDSGHSDQRGA